MTGGRTEDRDWNPFELTGAAGKRSSTLMGEASFFQIN